MNDSDATIEIRKRVLELIPKRLKGKFLDVGCGSGHLAVELSKFGEVYCIDLDDNLIVDSFQFRKADLNINIPHADETFSLVTATEVIEHLENPRHFLREIYRVLEKGGMAILTTPDVSSFKSRLYYLFKRKMFGFRDADYNISGHINAMTDYDFERICNELKFKIKHIEHGKSLIIVLVK
jgi:2-polyprenyl-3-methyl-5-hydroxy-6-metoxy-1,4-benzoquinol methylase